MDKRVALIECKNYDEKIVEESIHRLLAQFGGAKELAGGKKVLIKPNLLMAREPRDFTTTHPSVVKALVREFMNAGCEVTIADSCGGMYTTQILKKLYSVTGMAKVAEETGATLNYDTSDVEMEYASGKRISKVPIIKPVHDAEFIVSVAKLKTHGFAYYTGAVKNLFGVIPGLTKPMFHAKFPEKEEFCEMIVDLCQLVSPDFSVIDGVVGMQGKGPSGGTAKEAGLLLGGVNPHAVDLAGIRVMGFKSEDVPTIYDAQERGLIPKTPYELEYLGDDPKMHELYFIPASSKVPGFLIRLVPEKFRRLIGCLVTPYPQIHEKKCVGCGACARTCPMHTIEIVEGKAKIDYSQCVKCYCCHELCPPKAIGFKRIVKK
ncbi:MAG: DUF362 domain-containing protein [Clostridia bacterium]|nr:DUF362 domain-containing protein [Clostridia bacterium]